MGHGHDCHRSIGCVADAETLGACAAAGGTATESWSIAAARSRMAAKRARFRQGRLRPRHPPRTPVTIMPAMPNSAYLLPILLLLGSNIFMTIAWYGHLRFKETPLMAVILASWGIAFVEYCLAVPANRWGSAVYSTAQLKTMQEVITLAVFAGFSFAYLKEPLGWNHALGFSLIALGAFFVFQKW
jgi:uncharacterized protein (DUF486 family)